MNAHAEAEAKTDREWDVLWAIRDAQEKAYMEGDGEPQAIHLIAALAKHGLVIVEADTVATLTAERDALASDIAMRPGALKLAYDIREALGWNKYTSLGIMPDEVRRLRQIATRPDHILTTLQFVGSVLDLVTDMGASAFPPGVWRALREAVTKIKEI